VNRYEFEILSFLEREGKIFYSPRDLSDTLCISMSVTIEVIESLTESGQVYLDADNGLSITEAGITSLEPYRVKRAIILAAGFGSRMMPATEDRPKPMVKVNGVRIIDTLLDALKAAGVEEITIVGGYKFEKLKELEDKYPFIKIIENTEYASTNNISSAVLALDSLHDGCYLCEADLYISNPKVITKYQYCSNILGSYSLMTDDWCFRMKDGCVSDYRKGNTFCYNYYGISYWTPQDCEKLRKDFAEIFESPDGKDIFWEFVPFIRRSDDYAVEIRPCRKQDIMEIDSYYELSRLDPSYQ
jgi:CTP:phosphocholine cytidylyltransferase-like protein